MTLLPDTLRVHDFETPERTKQLEIIDKLHELGLGKDISLPLVCRLCEPLRAFLVLTLLLACGCWGSELR